MSSPETENPLDMSKVPQTDHYKLERRKFYNRYKYYKNKHYVFKKLGYQCEICGHAIPDNLQLHHDDSRSWHGMGGRDRFRKAREMIENGNDEDLELNCNKCHDLRDGGMDPKEILKRLQWDDQTHEEIAEDEGISIRNGWRL